MRKLRFHPVFRVIWWRPSPRRWARGGAVHGLDPSPAMNALAAARTDRLPWVHVDDGKPSRCRTPTARSTPPCRPRCTSTSPMSRGRSASCGGGSCGPVVFTSTGTSSSRRPSELAFPKQLAPELRPVAVGSWRPSAGGVIQNLPDPECGLPVEPVRRAPTIGASAASAHPSSAATPEGGSRLGSTRRGWVRPPTGAVPVDEQ